MPKVSVLMPVYNSRVFLKEAVESILSQTFKDFEFIIIDDGSQDGSELLLNEYASQDNRIKIIRNLKNMGIVFSLNRGLEVCRGDYVARMDSDDMAFKNRLARQAAIMDENPDILVLGSALSYIDSTGKELGVVRYCEPANRLLGSPLLHPTVMIRRSALVNNSLKYEEKYCFAEDYFLWLQFSKAGRIDSTDEVLLKYRLNQEATKIRKLKSSLWATLKVKKDAILVLKFIPDIREAAMILTEILLLLLPARLILCLYLKLKFKDCGRIAL